MKRILVLIFIVLFLKIEAQEVKKGLAVAGDKGIFIHLGKDFLNENSGKYSAYKIERKTGDSAFEKIASVVSPSSYDEFIEKYKFYNRYLPEMTELSDSVLNVIWKDAIASKNTDALKYYSGVLSIRLALGISYIDTTAAKDLKYIYKVNKTSMAGDDSLAGESMPVSFPGEVFYPKMYCFEKNYRGGNIEVMWKYAGDLRPALFYVFRRSAFEKEFKKISCKKAILQKADSMYFAISDASVLKEQTYVYYIVPADAYGNCGEQSVIEIVHAISSAEIFQPYKVEVKIDSVFNGLRLKWKFDQPHLAAGIEILRSEEINSPGELIASVDPNATDYLDQRIFPSKKYYYSLSVNLINGDKLPNTPKVTGYFLSDEIPLPPYDLTVSASTKGVNLHWKYSEKNINGFYVYRNNQSSAKLNLISSLIPAGEKDSVFTYSDSSSALSGKVSFKYCVQAVSRSNVRGLFSDTVTVMPIKTEEVLTPLITDLIFDGSVVSVFWEDLNAVDNSISSYKVFRRETGKEWILLTENPLPFSNNYFNDSSATEGKIYEYAVQAEDFFNNSGRKGVSQRIEILKDIPPAPAEIWAENTDNGILIKWTEVIRKNISSYLILRSDISGKEITAGTVKPEKLEFTDKDVKAGELYFYKVITVLENGNKSLPANEISIRKK